MDERVAKMTYTLIFNNQAYPIDPSGTTLGRTPDNTLVLSDPAVSRRHAFLWVQEGQLYIRDEGSANGTWVNGQPVTQMAPLQPGDKVQFGQVAVSVGQQETAPTLGPASRPQPEPLAAASVGTSAMDPALEADAGQVRSQRKRPVGYVIALVTVAVVLLVGAGILWVRGRGEAASVDPKPTVTPAVGDAGGAVEVTTSAVPEMTQTSMPSTSTPVATPEPTEAAPEPTEMPSDVLACLPDAAFVKDVTIPDNFDVTVRDSFEKVWRYRSTGCRAWEEGTQWVFVSGEQMDAPSAIDVDPIDLNATTDIAVTMQAPATPGTYRGYWQMMDAQGQHFGERAYVLIRAVAANHPQPTPTSRPVSPTPASSTTVSLSIVNDTGSNITIKLSGPESYDETFEPGEWPMDILAGTYAYTVVGCGTSESGTKEFLNAQEWTWWCD